MLHALVPYKYKKWSTLIGGVLIHLSLGSFYTFGNMSPYITSYLREYDGIDIRYSKSVWITTFFLIFMAIGTLTSGMLNSLLKLNVKYTIFFGCLTMTAGVILTNFSIKYSFILTLLTYGGMTGLGTGFAYIGPLSIAMKWFPDKKGLANSAILFGYGASAIIFDQIQTIYINPKNYAPDKPYSPKFPDEKYFSKLHIDLLERVPKTFLILGSSYAALQIIGFSLLASYYEQNENTTAINVEESNQSNSSVEQIESSNDINSLGVNYKSPTEGLSLSEVFRSPVYYIIITMMSTFTCASGFIVTFYKSFGLAFIEDDEFLAILGSISSIFNSTGRLFWGYLIDRLPFKICFLIIMTSIIALVSTIYLNKFIGIKEIYLIWVCAVFFCQCGLYVVMPTAIAKSFGQKNFTAIYGSTYLFGIPSSFLSAFLGSHEEQFGWFWLFFIGSCVSLISWSMGFLFNVKKSNGKDI